MDELAPFAARAWGNFYMIVGSAAGALTGLQFVVLTLIAEAGMLRGSSESLSAFASPNVVHFCTALLVSSIMGAPWHGLGAPGIAIAVTGACGLVYSFRVLVRALRQREYKPVLEDWIWHAALPILAYAALMAAGIQLPRVSSDPLYVVGGSVLLLVFIGIHNAWDTVTYVMLERARARKARPAAGEAAASGSTAANAEEAKRQSGPSV